MGGSASPKSGRLANHWLREHGLFKRKVREGLRGAQYSACQEGHFVTKLPLDSCHRDWQRPRRTSVFRAGRSGLVAGLKATSRRALSLALRVLRALAESPRNHAVGAVTPRPPAPAPWLALCEPRSSGPALCRLPQWGPQGLCCRPSWTGSLWGWPRWGGAQPQGEGVRGTPRGRQATAGGELSTRNPWGVLGAR